MGKRADWARLSSQSQPNVVCQHLDLLVWTAVAVGCRYFLRNLLDGDPAANTLSWRWVAGLQTRGKAYIARPDNIAKFTRGRFRPTDVAMAEAPPISGPPDPIPKQIDARTDWNRTRQTGLLLTEDDLSPEFLRFPVNGFEGFATLNSSQGRSPLGVSNTVAAFVDGAFNDTLGRIRSVAGRPTGHVLQTSSVDNLVDWARRVQIEQFVTPYSPVGPVQDALDILKRKLAPLGIDLLRIIRPSDATAWPKATHGFSRFRKIIPSLIRQNGRGMETVS